MPIDVRECPEFLNEITDSVTQGQRQAFALTKFATSSILQFRRILISSALSDFQFQCRVRKSNFNAILFTLRVFVRILLRNGL